MWAKPEGARSWHWFAFDDTTMRVPSVCRKWPSYINPPAKYRHSKPKEACCAKCGHWLDSGKWRLRRKP